MSWNMERGYLDNSNIMTYPWRALLSGASNGFTVYLLVDNENIDFMCKQIQGYKVRRSILTIMGTFYFLLGCPPLPSTNAQTKPRIFPDTFGPCCSRICPPCCNNNIPRGKNV
jgi:hypothetical protein